MIGMLALLVLLCVLCSYSSPFRGRERLTPSESLEWTGNLTWARIVIATLEPSSIANLPDDKMSRGIVMSCPVGQASAHAGGAGKPKNLFNGFATLARYLRNTLGSNLPIYNVMFEDELQRSEQSCTQLSGSLVNVHCLGMPKDGFDGYGFSKIHAIDHAPINQVIFVDCDAFLLRAPEYLFENEHFRSTGALFWGDTNGGLGEERLKNIISCVPPARQQYASEWWVRKGLDSGFFMLDKFASLKPFGKLLAISKVEDVLFQKTLDMLSMGDKDFWKLAWLLDGPVCRGLESCYVVPSMAAVGPICGQMGREWRFAGQVKLDYQGEMVAIHQISHMQVDRLLAVSIAGTLPEGGPPAVLGKASECDSAICGFRFAQIPCRILPSLIPPEAMTPVAPAMSNLIKKVAQCWHIHSWAIPDAVSQWCKTGK